MDTVNGDKSEKVARGRGVCPVCVYRRQAAEVYARLEVSDECCPEGTASRVTDVDGWVDRAGLLPQELQWRDGKRRAANY